MTDEFNLSTLLNMDEDCRIFIIGDSIFSEALEQMLASYPDMKVVGIVSSQALAKTAVVEASPHVIIIADASEQPQDKLGAILSFFPDLPLISVDLSRDYVQVITSRRVQTHRDDLLVAIRELSAQK